MQEVKWEETQAFRYLKYHELSIGLATQPIYIVIEFFDYWSVKS